MFFEIYILDLQSQQKINVAFQSNLLCV